MDTIGDETRWHLYRRGFAGMLPLWAGAIPVGLAFGVAARGIGLSIGQAQLMSLTVFSAAAQVSAVTAMAEGASTALLVATTVALNAQLLLIGVAVGRASRPAGLTRLATAWLLTDGAYGIAIGQDRRGRLRLPTLIGAGASMYLAFNLGTAIGATASAAVPDLRPFGVDLVAPLTFLAVLVPLVRTRTTLLVAVVAGSVALLLVQVMPTGLATLGAGIIASLVGIRASESTSTVAEAEGAKA